MSHHLQMKLYTWNNFQKPIFGKIHEKHVSVFIAIDKALFSNRKVLIFFLHLHGNMLWALIRSASLRHF